MDVTFLDGPLAGETREVHTSDVTVTLALHSEVASSGPVNRIVYNVDRDSATATYAHTYQP